jgi:hypothetical protein
MRPHAVQPASTTEDRARTMKRIYLKRAVAALATDRRSLAIGPGAMLFASILALSPSSAEAQCPQGWDISGGWGLKQSNQAVPNALVLGHAFTGKDEVNGSASYRNDRGKFIEGAVKGTVAGNNVHLEISWDNALTGIYDGKVGPRGNIEGTGYEKRSPSVKVSWFSDRAMLCPSAAAEPTPDPIRPGKFVTVHCLGNLIQVPNYRAPIADDVVLGGKYQVKSKRPGYVTIRTPLGKHYKQYDVPESCVTPPPN